MKKKFVTFLFAIGLTLCLSVPAFAAVQFMDVPANHWAAASINKMAEGGLIAGYGNNRYGLNDKLTIDQMATIIARAKGQSTTPQGSYWAYRAVDYCVNDLKCLPKLGAIWDGGLFTEVCTRELAYYMLVTGLGKGPDSEAPDAPSVTAADIPDFDQIDSQYQDAILKAYQLGLTVGMDDAMTFDPKSELTRAQAATMFVRAGWTKAIPAPPDPYGRLTIDELYNKYKAMGIWTESTDPMGYSSLSIKDSAKYGGISVRKTEYTLNIHLPEWNDRVWGPITSAGLYDSKTGKIMYSSGYCYEARMLVKQLLEMAYPNEKEAAVAGYKSVFIQQAEDSAPHFFQWLDGRALMAGYDQGNYHFTISIFELNDEIMYKEFLSDGVTEWPSHYATRTGSWENAVKAYELNRW